MPTPEPFAVAANLQVFACDSKARRRGVQPGMSLPAAQALSRQLIIRQRDPAAETEALLGLAAWAMQFTPAVALELPDMLVLEISGSLKLLGGLPSIEARMRSQLADLGYSTQITSAPTSRAACWMVRQGTESNCTGDSLEKTVSALPITVLQEETHGRLQAIGATTIADVQALPRDGLARRFGQPLLDDIDRALGKLPEARTFFQPPRQFHSCIELAMEVRQSEAIIFAAQRLFVQLAGFLAACACGIQRMTLKLIHRESITPVNVSMLSPGRDAMHFTLLLREQLGRISLGEPVQSLSLTADELVPLAGENLALFDGNVEATAQSWQQLVDRLRSRLGKASVQGISNAEDHRPEHCSVVSEPGTRQLELEFAARPFWLLPVPRLLPEVGAVPHHEGPLELLAGPERIESGWWDGQEALRDYFVARSTTQALLWIYRERRPSRLGQWYLHGLFS